MKLEFMSRSVNEGFARMAAAAFLMQLDPTLEELGDIKTAVSEAVTNAIVHAYPDGLGKIRLQGKIFEDHSVEFTVRDYGCGIADIAQARTPLFTDNIETSHDRYQLLCDRSNSLHAANKDKCAHRRNHDTSNHFGQSKCCIKSIAD